MAADPTKDEFEEALLPQHDCTHGIAMRVACCETCVKAAHARAVTEEVERARQETHADCTKGALLLAAEARAEGVAQGRREEMAEHHPLCQSDKDYQRAAGRMEIIRAAMWRLSHDTPDEVMEWLAAQAGETG